MAALTCIVSDEIKQGVRSARNGNYPVRTSDHILLLNWNSQCPALLRQIAAASQAPGRRGGDGPLGAFGGSALRGGGRQKVVILADRPKAEMDATVYETLRDRGGNIEVHTRQGTPFKLTDLKKVAAHRASTILLLHPDGSSQGSAEAIKASAAMCLTALDAAPEGQRVVMQMPGDGGGAGGDAAAYLSSLVSTARVAGRDFQVAALPDRKLMHRLVAQTAAQPGIFTCWLDILTLHGASPQFMCRPAPKELEGKPFEEVRRLYLDCVVLGYIDAAGGAAAPAPRVALNPPGAAPLPAGAQLVLLGRNENSHPQPRSGVYSEAAPRAAERLQRERTYKSRPRNIIVCGWPEEGIPELCSGFADLTHSGSTVTFITGKEPPPEWPHKAGNCKFNYVAAKNPTLPKVLIDAGVKGADTVVVGPGAAGGPELETDARVLASLMQVQDAVMASKRKGAPHVVAPIRRHATSKLGHQYFDVLAKETQHRLDRARADADAAASEAAAAAASNGGAAEAAGRAAAAAGALAAAQAASDAVIRAPEFINTGDVISAVLTQVVAESAYDTLMTELLFSPKGQELYLRNPASFNIAPGTPIPFSELAEAARLTGQTALGYIRGGRLAVLAPHATHQVVFGPDDRVVVIAEEF
ncbi:ion channel DMI1-like [Raphidocelis subcapitata]|uniref:Ion channel DMI1-like n=1 Tax=Raphidocelis subcapitata TaxID=307507 RepID=A0A2V0NZ15_9CHLO|nr:ion channel DMI1-like [Raphidocelis subcapitata]|eukprot:GBF90167.1 ion channel DMI1-like [Raphidocelis subcapitata]